jgi:hypothetical protein
MHDCSTDKKNAVQPHDCIKKASWLAACDVLVRQAAPFVTRLRRKPSIFASKGAKMAKPLTSHERAALGLRQTMTDLECADQHLTMVQYAIDDQIEGMNPDIESIKGLLVDLHERIMRCQKKVYANWRQGPHS